MLMKLFAMMVLTGLGLGLAGCRFNQTNPDSSNLQQAWADCTLSFHARVKEEAASGLFSQPLFSANTLPEFERKCDGVVAAAAGRADIIKAVELLRDAVRFESKVDFMPSMRLIPPDNEVLAHLLQGAEGKLSPGRARGACMVAWSRLAACFGAAGRHDEFFMEFSEKRYNMIASPRRSPGASSPPRRNLPPDEMEVLVCGDGSVMIDGKAVAEKDLHDAFVLRVERSRQARTELLSTIRPGTGVEYQHISKILEIMDQAGVRGISFQADEAEDPP